MSKEQADAGTKIGQGHLAAMGRSGLKELASILPAFPESVRPVEEMGLFGNALPQEIYEDTNQKPPNVEQNLEMQM
jgi:hypothetical protein